MKFKNYRNDTITLTKSTWGHINEFHPEISEDVINKTLKKPLEVRQSLSKSNSQLYYSIRLEERFYCVVVKQCDDGNFISTALTTDKMKAGKIIYRGEL